MAGSETGYLVDNHPGEGRVLAGDLDVEASDLTELGFCTLAGVWYEACYKLAAPVLDDREEQRLFGGKVVVDRALGVARSQRDFVEPGPGEATAFDVPLMNLSSSYVSISS